MLRFLKIIVLVVCGLGKRCADAAELAWPAVTNETKPWSRWWWLGSITTEDGLRSAMEQYAAAGLGGLEITPLYGVRGEEDKFIQYLSPQWVARFEFVLAEGKRLGLGIDLLNGTGWPFGGPWVTPEDTCKTLAHKTYTVKAGEKLGEPVVMAEKGMVSPRSVSLAQIKEPFSETADLQKLAIDQLKMPGPLKLNTLMAFSDSGAKPMNLTDKVSADGTLDWTAPADAGTWTLYAVFSGLHGRMVKRAAPGDEGHVPDHFSESAITHYLAKFDQALAGQKLDGLRALFCDSYEVDEGTAGEANFTPQFFDEFQRLRGYDLRQHLPAFFAKETNDENARLVCDYRETISDLLLDNFAMVWRDWARGHGKIDSVSGTRLAGERAGFICSGRYSGDGRIWEAGERRRRIERGSGDDVRFFCGARFGQAAGFVGNVHVAGRSFSDDAGACTGADQYAFSGGDQSYSVSRDDVFAAG